MSSATSNNTARTESLPQNDEPAPFFDSASLPLFANLGGSTVSEQDMFCQYLSPTPSQDFPIFPDCTSLDLSLDHSLHRIESPGISTRLPWQDTSFWADAQEPVSLQPLASANDMIGPVALNSIGPWNNASRTFWPSRIPHSLVLNITNLYLRQIHPSIPMCRASDISNGVAYARYKTDPQFASMILSLCAFTLLQPQQPNSSLLSAEMPTVSDFFDEASKLHNEKCSGENLTINTVLTNIYISGALELRNQKDAAWLKLQEAITVSEILDLPDVENQQTLDADEWEQRTRLYLCLSIIERQARS